MTFRLERIDELSGDKTTIYSILVDGEKDTIFHSFLKKYLLSHRNEISNIVTRIKIMGQKEGARENYFKINEGIPGDGVCALYDSPNSKLRVYCIRYGNQMIILGSGGVKKEGIKALQEDAILKQTNYFIREVSKQITQRIKDREINYSNDGLELEGNLIFTIEYEEK